MILVRYFIDFHYVIMLIFFLLDDIAHLITQKNCTIFVLFSW